MQVQHIEQLKRALNNNGLSPDTLYVLYPLLDSIVADEVESQGNTAWLNGFAQGAALTDINLN